MRVLLAVLVLCLLSSCEKKLEFTTQYVVYEDEDGRVTRPLTANISLTKDTCVIHVPDPEQHVVYYYTSTVGEERRYVSNGVTGLAVTVTKDGKSAKFKEVAPIGASRIWYCKLKK